MDVGPGGVKRLCPWFTRGHSFGFSGQAHEHASEKQAAAVAFLARVRQMPAAELNALIVAEAGEDLAKFFLAYASQVLAAAPERLAESASSLLLMGYLIRAAEERTE